MYAVQCQVLVSSTMCTCAEMFCHNVCRLELLEAEEAEQVCLLVYAQNRTIARTSGEFLCTYYFTEVLIEAAKKMNVPKGAVQTGWCDTLQKEKNEVM